LEGHVASHDVDFGMINIHGAVGKIKCCGVRGGGHSQPKAICPGGVGIERPAQTLDIRGVPNAAYRSSGTLIPE
jgi:hypothetical protein